MSREEMVRDLLALAERFSEGWHDGIKIDALDIELLTDAARALAAQPAPPPECQTEAEKTAFAFGWWKALEAQRTWIGLTDEERILCRSYDPEEAVAKTEAKLKEKNT